MIGRAFGLWFPKNYQPDLSFIVGRTLIGLCWMVICLSFLVSTVQMVAAQSALEPVIALTAEEQAWLKAHPNIVLGYTDAFEPEVIVNPDGSHSGILVDFLDELNRRLGTRITLRIDSIPGLLQKATNKEVDGILEIHPEYADKLGLLKSIGYLRAYPAVFARKNVSFAGPDDFAGKKIAIIDKVYFTEKMVREYGEQATILRVKDAIQGMKSVSEGVVDLYIGVSYNSYYITKYQIFDVVTKYIFRDFSDKFGMAVRPDWPELVLILNKGISSFSQNDIDAIVAKWVHLPQQEITVELTPEEQAWRDQNHTVRVRVANAEPYIFLSEGKPQGIAVDLLNLISLRSGVKFRYIIPSPSFAEDLEKIARYEGPDLISSIMRTPEREKFLLFTKDYSSSPRFIFTRDDSEFVAGMNDLSGKRVAVIKAFVVHKYLEKNHPEIKLSIYKNVEDSLKAVSSGKDYAFIGDLKFTPIMITKLGLYNLKMAAPSSLPDHAQAMATRNDWPELQSILNKGFDSISEEEKTAIVNKWTTIKVAYGIRPAALIKWVLFVVMGAFGLVLFFVFWNRSLSKKVEARTFELKSSADSLKAEITQKIEAEMALKASRRFTDNLIETANVMIVGLDEKGNVNLFNPAAEKITGYTISELHGRNWFELLVPKEQYPQVYLEFSRLMAGGRPNFFRNTILTKNGEERVISWSNSEIIEGDQVVGMLSFGIDITERSLAEEALQESEEKFRYLVEQSPLSIQVFDLDGRIVQVNESWKALWGIFEERLPEVFEKYNVFEDEEARELDILPLIEKAFKGEGVTLPVIDYNASTTLKTLEIGDAGGNKRWVRAQFYPIKNSRGEVVNVVGIEEDITSSIQAEQEILQYQQRLKALASQLTIVEEKERRKIAADLHDHVGHSLALARMQLNGILQSDSDLERNILVKDISNIMLQALQDTRGLIFELSSPSMNEIGLGAAISEWLEEQIEKRHGLKTEFSDTIENEHRKTLDNNVRALIFRNVRELLTNVVKHARAQKVSVSLKEHANSVTVVIEDDGTGFDPAAENTSNGKQGGFGLFSIHERMTDLGGTFDIQSAPGKGCRVEMRVPVEKEAIVLNRRKSD